MLVEMDFDGIYHLRLIGEVIGYKFPKGSVHEHMENSMGVIMMRLNHCLLNIYMDLY